jgi:hypothetical protein
MRNEKGVFRQEICMQNLLVDWFDYVKIKGAVRISRRL